MTDRPSPFHLPVLDNRGDVAARLAAIDSIVTDDADGPATRPRAPEAVSRPRNGASGDAYRAAARVRPAGTSTAGPSTGAVVAARTHMLRPDGAPAAAPVSYAADDWRGRIKGAPARADAHVYGAPGGPRSASAAAGTAAVSVPAARAGDATMPAGTSDNRGTAAAGRGTATAAQATESAKPVSMLDRAARIGLLGALLAIFVLLFIFGPKISQWWGKL